MDTVEAVAHCNTLRLSEALKHPSAPPAHSSSAYRWIPWHEHSTLLWQGCSTAVHHASVGANYAHVARRSELTRVQQTRQEGFSVYPLQNAAKQLQPGRNTIVSRRQPSTRNAILAYQCTARRLIHAMHYIPKPSHDAPSVWMVALNNCVLLPVINIYLPVQLIGDIHTSIF